MSASLGESKVPLFTELGNIRIRGGFWKDKQELIGRSSLPFQWRALNDEIPGAEPSHALENFRIAAGESSGDFKGTVFQDSDVAKWLEAASYDLLRSRDAELEARVDEVIRLLGKAQGPDGYLNTYFTIVAPERRWENLAWGHELYCAGHLVEAAVAHAEATGKTSLLEIAQRLADCIDGAFGPEEGKIHGCSGHPEIELALFRLWRLTREPRYRELAIYFVEERGRNPALFAGGEAFGLEIPEAPWRLPDYFQAHAPVREQRRAEGHAVRAVYLYAAMTDECAETGDPELLAALHRLWDSAVGRRMYITGALGSQAQGERFTADFDLPSDTAYAETCASIGLIFWAARMSALESDSRYADALERAIYNGALSGISMDGMRYFYVNPLEISPETAAFRQDHRHVRTERVQWLGCACCPPNIARLVASIGGYIYGRRDGGIAVHHYAESEASFELSSGGLHIVQHTRYPWEGRIRAEIEPSRGMRFPLSLRIPDWCDSYACRVNGELIENPRAVAGYLCIDRFWQGRESVELELEMKVKIMRADARISELAGKLALQRGPLVYCIESCDNGRDLHNVILDPDAEVEARFDPELMGGSVRILAPGFREEGGDRDEGGPYRSPPPYAAADHSGPGGRRRLRRISIVAVPYHQWGNREPGAEMRVWIRGL